MSSHPAYPKCNSEYAYVDGALLIRPECAHEWSPSEEQEPSDNVVHDANGNALADGDIDGDIDCKIEGLAAMKLKQEFVKKV